MKLKGILAEWGWSFSNENCVTDRQYEGEKVVAIIHVPVIFGNELTKSDFLSFLTELEQNPTCIPTPIHSILNSKACRSAIMFGDNLTLEQAEILIQDLSKTKFPFQCAHGK